MLYIVFILAIMCQYYKYNWDDLRVIYFIFKLFGKITLAMTNVFLTWTEKPVLFEPWQHFMGPPPLPSLSKYRTLLQIQLHYLVINLQENLKLFVKKIESSNWKQIFYKLGLDCQYNSPNTFGWLRGNSNFKQLVGGHFCCYHINCCPPLK